MRDQEIAFQEAAMADAVSVTRNLLSIGCLLNWAVVRDGKYNSTLFQKALQNHCTRTVSILLENAVSVDGYNDSGWTALHSATSAQNVDAVSRILPRIADRNHRDKDGWSALDLAIWSRNEELRQLLDDGSLIQHRGLRIPAYTTLDVISLPPKMLKSGLSYLHTRGNNVVSSSLVTEGGMSKTIRGLISLGVLVRNLYLLHF